MVFNIVVVALFFSYVTSSSSSSSPSSGERLHSTDIAFKPTEDGWGYSPRYSSNFDRIFGNKAQAPAAPTEATETQQAPPPTMSSLDVVALKRILRENEGSATLAEVLGAAVWVPEK